MKVSLGCNLQGFEDCKIATGGSVTFQGCHSCRRAQATGPFDATVSWSGLYVCLANIYEDDILYD